MYIEALVANSCDFLNFVKFHTEFSLNVLAILKKAQHSSKDNLILYKILWSTSFSDEKFTVNLKKNSKKNSVSNDHFFQIFSPSTFIKDKNGLFLGNFEPQNQPIKFLRSNPK